MVRVTCDASTKIDGVDIIRMAIFAIYRASGIILIVQSQAETRVIPMIKRFSFQGGWLPAGRIMAGSTVLDEQIFVRFRFGVTALTFRWSFLELAIKMAFTTPNRGVIAQQREGGGAMIEFREPVRSIMATEAAHPKIFDMLTHEFMIAHSMAT
jgi:hypothetical protein